MYTFLMVTVLGFQELDSMTSYVYSSDEEIQCNGGTCNEKRRRVHNVVEKRRKDKINSWIFRIGDLLPDRNRKKQCINEILEQAVIYIRYLQDANDKLLQDKCTEVQAEELRRMRKKMKELEEENTQCLRLLQKAGISSITCPEEFCDHKSGRYSNKLTPEQASALLTHFENDSLANGVTKLRSVMQNKCDANDGKSLSYNVKYDLSSKKCNEVTESVSEKLATYGTEKEVPSEKTVSPISTPQSLTSSCAENQTIAATQYCPSPSVCTNSSKCQYAISCSSEETNLSLDVCDITAVTQALPPVPVMSTSQNSSVHENSVHKSAKQSVAPLNQFIQPQILSPCAPAPVTNRGSTIQNISSPLLVINEHGIPVLHNIVSFQNIQPSVFSNCSSAPAILTSSNNGFGQTQSPLAIPQIGPYGNYRPIYVTKDTNNSAKVASVPTTFGVTGSPNSSIAGVPILTSNSCFTSTVRPQSTLTGEAKSILSPIIAQVPVPGSSQGGALKLSTGLQSSSLGQGTLSQIISHPMDDLTASNMHIQPCNNHSISQNLPSNTLPPTMVTPGGILVGQPLSIGQQGQVLTMGNGQFLTAQSSISAQQPFPSALILPNGQVIPVVSQPSVVYANPAVNNNIVLAQTGKQNLQATSPSVVTGIKNQNSSLLANNTILFSPSGNTGNNFKFSSVALTLSQASNSQSSTSFTSDMTSTITQKSKTMEPLQASQNDNVIVSAEEELLKCNSTTQAFQGPLTATTCSKSNCHNSEVNSRRASTLGTKSGSVSKSSKASPAAGKRAGRILKPKPSSTSPHQSGVLSAKVQHSGRDLGMNTRKQVSCNSSTNSISSSETSTEKMTNSTNANLCTNSLSSNSPISRTDDNINHDSTETSLVSSSSNASARMTTDILAKATESIFSSCVSDLSPSITSFSSGKNEALHNANECSLINSEKNKNDGNEPKPNKQHRFYQMDSSNSSVTDSCVSSQPQDLLSTLTATVFGDSSADSSGDELAFTQVESSPSKLISTLSRGVTTKNVKGSSHVEIDIAKLKCRTNNNNGVPPIKKVKTVEPSGNGTATSTEQYREKVQGNCFVSNGLTPSTNNEDSHNRISSTTKCFLSEEKQKIVCSTTNPLSSEMTTMPTSVSQLLLADSTSALCSKTSQSNSERENSANVNFVNSGENSAPDTELPALILGSLGDDSNTPSSVNGSSNSGIPFLALSPSEHFPSELPKEAPLNNNGSFNMLDNCRSSNIDSIEAAKSKRTPSIHQKGDINKANTSSEFADINRKSSDQSKQVLSSSRLPDQETDISSTLSPPLVMKSNCSQTIASQQRIAHEDNLNAIRKETQCPPTSNILGSTSQNDVNCQAPILSSVSNLSFIAPSPPPLLSRNMMNENHVSISSHFPPLSSQNNLGISSSQTHLASTASSQSSNSTHISSFKQSTERSSTPKKSLPFPSNNPPSIITSTAVTSTTSTSTNFASHTTASHTLSNYSAEALIGQQSTMASTPLINPIVSQSYYSTTNSDCPRTNRPPISYSAESLIQTQSCINKKQDMVVSKEPMPSNVSPNMNTYRHQMQRLQQHGGQQGISPQAINVSQSLVTNVTDRRLSCSNLIPSSDMMPQNSLQSNFHLQGTPSYANLTHTISTGPQQNLMNNHFSGGPPILMRHGAPACQQLDQCLPCTQPSHNSSSLPQGYSLSLGGNKNCHTVNTFHQNRPPVDASISQTLPSCLSNSGNLSNIPITNSQQQNGCLFPNHAPSGSLLQVPDTNFSILQNSSSSASFNNQVRNESRPPVFNNFPQHAQNSLVNNLFHGSFVNTQRNEISNAMPSQQSNRPNEGIKHATREQRSSSQSQSPPNQTKISPKSKSNAKKSKQNTGTEDVTMPSTHYENINVRMPTHFSVPDLSFPRNETPCLGNTYFGGSQRPLVPTISNIQTQNKNIPTVASADPNLSANPTYNPLFRRQSENSLNFNFQPSSFSVNSLHRPATTGSENIPSAQITCHTTTASAHPIPNFNLSNIFPDISTSNESINLPGMKFHHNNHIISPPTSNQIQASEGSMTHPTNHQNRAPPPLYHGRTHPPVIHNSVGFNGILGPNAHAFEGHSTQVAVGINNTMGHPPPPPPFASSHSHTPSFGNVLAPLNFPMHDH